jgi:hypothetical protein
VLHISADSGQPRLEVDPAGLVNATNTVLSRVELEDALGLDFTDDEAQEHLLEGLQDSVDQVFEAMTDAGCFE